MNNDILNRSLNPIGRRILYNIIIEVLYTFLPRSGGQTVRYELNFLTRNIL